MSSSRASALSVLLLACDGEPNRDSTLTMGEQMLFTTTERDREFHVRICQGNKDPVHLEAHVELEAVHVTKPGNGVRMLLETSVKRSGPIKSETTSVPGDANFFGLLSEHACSIGFMVAFHRVDEAADGAFEVSWSVDASAEEHEYLPLVVWLDVVY